MADEERRKVKAGEFWWYNWRGQDRVGYVVKIYEEEQEVEIKDVSFRVRGGIDDLIKKFNPETEKAGLTGNQRRWMDKMVEKYSRQTAE